MDLVTSEDGAGWLAFLRSLVKRGLRGVRLVISDAHEGLRQAIAKVLHEASWQRSSINMSAAGRSRWSSPPPG
jgi:transposase-like protein